MRAMRTASSSPATGTRVDRPIRVRRGRGWIRRTRCRAPPDGFCCDQLTLYDPQRKIWIWILQYIQQNQTNVFRIAVSTDANFPGAGGWYWWDIAPATLNNAWTTVWFDYPDAAFSRDHLYVTFNVFSGQHSSAPPSCGSRSIRWPQVVHSGSAGGARRTTVRSDSRSRPLPTESMYFGSHNSGSSLRLFSWPDTSNNISQWDIGVTSWNGNISSTAPNGVDWLARD